jgi:hypothetical protein
MVFAFAGLSTINRFFDIFLKLELSFAICCRAFRETIRSHAGFARAAKVVAAKLAPKK